MSAGFFPEPPKKVGASTASLHNWIVYLALGLFVLFWAGFSLIMVFIGAGDWIGDMALWVCTPVTLAVGLAFIAYGLKVRRDFMRLQEIAGVLRSYRRMALAVLARKLGVTEFEAERVVGQCIDLGYIEGFIDRTTGEFVSKEAVGQVAPVSGCPRCGAPAERLVLVGETHKCGSCGSVIPSVGPPQH